MAIRVASPLLLASALLCGCGPAKLNTSFQKNFLFGVATAGFQNEMGCPTIPEATCEDQNSDWYQWITSPTIRSNSLEAIAGGPPTTGPGWFELYPADLALAKNTPAQGGLGVGAVRISIEWSRLFPTSTVGVTGYAALKEIASAPGIAFYHSLLGQIISLGMTPLVTVDHYTLPLWIHNGVDCNQDIMTCTQRGWLDSGTITEIAKYAGFVAQEYGGQVDLWATLNEPFANPLSGYLSPGPSRSDPPGVFADATDAKTVIVNEINAHAQMYNAIKAADTVDADGDGVAAEVGLVYNMAPVYPADPSNELDVQAAQNTFYLYNSVFLNAIIDGKLDANMTGASTAVDRPDLARMDYVGLNYYNRVTVAGMNTSLFPEYSPLLTFDPTNAATQFFGDYPRGIYEMITYLDQTYHHIPIYVTETGVTLPMGAADPGAPNDAAQLLQWAQKGAISGADVRGLFWWTLTDNYEWNHGMTEVFGLYAVDTTTKARTLRPLGETYQQVVQARGIPAALAKADPIQ